MAHYLFKVTITFTDDTSRTLFFDTTSFTTEEEARAYTLATIDRANRTRGKYLDGHKMSDVRSRMAERV